MKPKSRVFAVLGLVFVISLGVYFWTRPGGDFVVLIGTVDANQVIVSSKVAGRIDRLLVDEGQAVKRGELIAQIDDADLKARREEARAQLNSLRAQVRQSRESYASTQGETGADVVNAEAALRAAQAALEEAEAQARQQELDTQRMVALAEAGVASQQDRDRAEQTLAADEARVRANRNQVHAAQATLETMKARLSQASAAEANVAAACARLGLRTAWISALPANAWGERIVREMTGHGVDCSSVRMIDDARVGVYFLEFGTAPRPIRVLYDRRDSAFARLTPESIEWEAVRQARLVHVTGITPALGSGPRRIVEEALVDLDRVEGKARQV